MKNTSVPPLAGWRLQAVICTAAATVVLGVAVAVGAGVDTAVVAMVVGEGAFGAVVAVIGLGTVVATARVVGTGVPGVTTGRGDPRLIRVLDSADGTALRLEV